VIEQVKSDLTAAMRAGDRSRVDALRLVLSALQRAEKAVPAGAFSEADAEAVLRRERKQRLAVNETGAESMRDMGRVMGLVTARGEGRVDGAAAAALVRARLGG
jgi:uncharacterized protein